MAAGGVSADVARNGTAAFRTLTAVLRPLDDVSGERFDEIRIDAVCGLDSG